MLSQEYTTLMEDNLAALARARFADALIRHLKLEHGIEKEQAAGWLSKRLGMRWQTTQGWVLGRSMPVGDQLYRVAKALGMDLRTLMGPLELEDPTWPSWAAFLATPEGSSLTQEERDILRIFPWKARPTVAELRNLLAFYRGNADRADSLDGGEKSQQIRGVPRQCIFLLISTVGPYRFHVMEDGRHDPGCECPECESTELDDCRECGGDLQGAEWPSCYRCRRARLPEGADDCPF